MPLWKISSLLLLSSLSLCLSKEEEKKEESSEAAEWCELLTAQYQKLAGFRATYDGRSKEGGKLEATVVSLSDRSQIWARVDFKGEKKRKLYWLANNDEDTVYVAMNGVCIQGMKNMNAMSELARKISTKTAPNSERCTGKYQYTAHLYLDRTSFSCNSSSLPGDYAPWEALNLKDSKGVREWPETVEFDTVNEGRIRINRETGFMQQQILENEEGKRRTLKLRKLETDLTNETLLKERPPFPEKTEQLIDLTKDVQGLGILIGGSFGKAAYSLLEDPDSSPEIENRIQQAGTSFGPRFLQYEPMKKFLDWACNDPSMETYSKYFFKKEGEQFLAQKLAEHFSKKEYFDSTLPPFPKGEEIGKEEILHCFNHFMAGYVADSWSKKFREEIVIEQSKIKLGTDFLEDNIPDSQP